MNVSYLKKALFRDRYNIESFAKTFGIGMGRSFFFTLTFRDNITDKREASELVNLLLTHVRKTVKVFNFVSVAERQKRGAWHFHFICSCKIFSLKSFKNMVRSFISRSSKPFGFTQARWTYGRDLKGIIIYLSKYLTKGDRRECGVRYVSYSRTFNTMHLPFSWVYGRPAVWRSRCSELDKVLPFVFKFFYFHCKYQDKIDALSTVWDDWEKSNKSFLLLSPSQYVLNWIDKNSPSWVRYLADCVCFDYTPIVSPDFVYKPVFDRSGVPFDYFSKIVGYNVCGAGL